MKKFIKFLENRLYCWKLLVIYMALTLWNAPAWCFTVFWIGVGTLLGTYTVIFVLAILVYIIEAIRIKKT